MREVQSINYMSAQSNMSRVEFICIKTVGALSKGASPYTPTFLLYPQNFIYFQLCPR